MPWKASEKLPPAAEKLKGHERAIFVAAANAALKQYKDDGRAIATGLAAVKKYKENLKKSFSDVVKNAFLSILDSFSNKSDIQKSDVLKEEEMISYEVVYEPNVKDAHRQWMTPETLESACSNFNENLKKGVVQPNLFHLKNTDTFEIVDTWIQKELDVIVEQTGEKIKAGTWIAKLKYNNESLWKLRKANIVQGVSIGCKGKVDEETGEITNVSFDMNEEE